MDVFLYSITSSYFGNVKVISKQYKMKPKSFKNEFVIQLIVNYSSNQVIFRSTNTAYSEN